MSLRQLYNCTKCGRNLGADNRSAYPTKTGFAHRICPRRRLRRGERKRRKIVRYRYGTPDLTRSQHEHRYGHMTDPRSYITTDERQILYGEDWKWRVLECFERDKGLCQQQIIDDALGWNYSGTIRICGSAAVDADHIIKRSKQRDDRLTNLRSLCRFHHNMRHKENQTRFGGGK